VWGSAYWGGKELDRSTESLVFPASPVLTVLAALFGWTVVLPVFVGWRGFIGLAGVGLFIVFFVGGVWWL
jgi:hypothetical protein